MTQYTVGEHYTFIRLTPDFQAAVVSTDLLNKDVDQLAWLHPLTDITVITLKCFSVERNTYHFQDGRQGYWSSATQWEADEFDWRIVEHGRDPMIFTALAPIKEYVKKIIANAHFRYPQWAVEKAKSFQFKLDVLDGPLRGFISDSESWDMGSMTLSKRAPALS